MRRLTEKQAQFLSQRFNASCTTPGVTNVTQMEIAVNDWLKELIAESAALHESVAQDFGGCTCNRKLPLADYSHEVECPLYWSPSRGTSPYQHELDKATGKAQPEPERGVLECLCEGEFPEHCGPECKCWHHDPFASIRPAANASASQWKLFAFALEDKLRMAPSPLPVREQSAESSNSDPNMLHEPQHRVGLDAVINARNTLVALDPAFPQEMRDAIVMVFDILTQALMEHFPLMADSVPAIVGEKEE